MICVLAVYSHDNLALKHHLSHRFTEEPNEVLDCFGKKNVNFNDNEILNFRRHMICKAFLKTLLVLCWHVTTLILFNCTASYFLGFPQVWQQVLHADVQNHLLETTEQLRSLCSSTEENSGALLEVALTRQQELAQQALRRNLSIPLLIYTQSSSGWGNNILGLISTLLLAMVTKRALFVHFHPVKLENIIQDKWGVFPDLSLLATSRNMSLEKLMKNQVYSIHASEHDQIWLPFTKQMERAYLNILRFHTDSISFSNVVLQSNQFFAPLLYIRKDYNYQLCRILGNRPFYSIANKVLQFTPEIKRAALVFMQEMQFHKKLVIGMQIRLRNNAPRWKKLNSLDRLRSTVQCAANVALQQTSLKPVVLFIASDDTDNLSHIRKMTCLEIATFDSRRANRYFLNDSTQIRAAKHAFVDIFLLSQTDQMVSSWGSTFGYLAHGISGRPPFSVDLQGRCSRLLSSEPTMHHFYRVDNLRLTQKPYSCSIIEWINMNHKARVIP